MKSIKFLLLSLALIAHSSFTMSESVIGGLIALGSGMVNIPSDLHSLYNLYSLRKNSSCLNTDEKMQPILKKLLNTYANDKTLDDIQFYMSPTVNAPIATSFGVYIDPVTKDALLKDENNNRSAAARCIIGHELGHIQKGHATKGTLILYASRIAPLLLNTLLLPHMNWKYLYSTNQIAMNLLLKIYLSGVKRKNELEADQHAIEYTKDTADLKAMAYLLEKVYKVSTQNAGESIANIFFKIDEHEHPLKRAKRFNDAASEVESEAELETKLKATDGNLLVSEDENLLEDRLAVELEILEEEDRSKLAKKLKKLNNRSLIVSIPDKKLSKSLSPSQISALHNAGNFDSAINAIQSVTQKTTSRNRSASSPLLTY